ncbi:MAG TPA: hypothetical protein VJS44_08435 [Pyrinomonadaceae bacterium]|nr:hypothetical protein [Pyrinomonadaceae bacterium]
MAFESKILTLDEWDLVAPIVRGVFRNAMPTTEAQAVFPAVMHGENLAGFIHLEALFHYNSIWVAPEHRNNPRVAMRLMLDAHERLSQLHGFSAIAMPEAESHIKMYKRFGGRSLGVHEVWRRDY